MIGNLDSLNQSYSRAPQLTNLWDFYLEDWGNDSRYAVSRFNVVSSNLPFVASLETDSFNTGENFYTDFKYPSSFTLELRENTEFTVYEYFKNWMSKVFDPVKGHFLSDRSVNPQSRTKMGTVHFYSYKLNPRAYSLFSEQFITEKIKGITARASQTMIEQAKRVANKNIPYPLSLGASQAASIVSGKVQSGIASLTPDFGDMFEEVTTKTFFMENVRFLSLGDTPLSYGEGDQLTLSVELVADRFYDSDLKRGFQETEARRPTIF